ncbi:MAG: gluconate 2-dehydrogenase subunit 3 family protein [Acidimicrobiales bacterium]
MEQKKVAINRRQFLGAALAGGAVVALPLEIHRALAASARTAARSAGTAAFYFFTPEQRSTCQALSARIVPSTDPVTGAFSPGATEAAAVVYIDRFLGAFDLPKAVADEPAIYLTGRWSGRNPFPDAADGEPSSTFPPDQMLSSDGQAHFMALSPLQVLSWRSLLVGFAQAVSEAPPWVSDTWAAQVRSGTIPRPPEGGLQAVYRLGLAAFDSYSESVYGVPFAQASPDQQDLLIEAAGNVVLSPFPLPSPPAAPAAAKALFPYVVLHTFQGCYGLPEYRWMSGASSTFMWQEIGWDGDTQPLGNSVYDETLYGPGQGPNAGFGDAEVYLPRGGYKEYRPVSYLGNSSGVANELTAADVAPWAAAPRGARPSPGVGG